MKRCAKCKTEKELSDFRSYPNARISYCITCQNEISRLWRHNNKERVAFLRKRWRAKNPNRNVEQCRKYYAANRDKCKLYRDKYRKTYKIDPRKQLEYLLRYHYKYSLADYEIKLAEQGGKCGICNELPKRRLAVDHDHATGKVRGLLCIQCNVLLGYARDRKEILTRSIWYLQSHENKEIKMETK